MINWKPTLLGIIAGTLTILQTTLTSYQNGTPVQWLQVASGIALMALGLVAKSFDVTGAGPAAVAVSSTGEVKSSNSVKTTLASITAIMFLGCASNQLVSATASNGDQFPYCLEVTFNWIPLQADTLFCAGLNALQAEQAKQSALHPENTYRIIAQKRVDK